VYLFFVRPHKIIETNRQTEPMLPFGKRDSLRTFSRTFLAADISGTPGLSKEVIAVLEKKKRFRFHPPALTEDAKKEHQPRGTSRG